MTFNFQYNRRSSPLFDNQFSPGSISCVGKDGSTGNEGIHGSSLYFINYEPDNDFIKDLLLNKIENNIVLSSDKGKRLPEGKFYTSGDLILTSKYYMYKLVDADEDSKYKFDIQFVGELRNTSTDNLTDEEKMSRMVQAVALNENQEQSSFIRRSVVSVSRSMDASAGYQDSSIYTDTTEKFKKLYKSYYNNAPSLPYNLAEDSMSCIELKPIVILSGNMQADASNYDFYLRIYLKNEKTPSYCSFDQVLYDNNNTIDYSRDPSEQSLQKTFKFYKCIEIPLFKYFPGINDINSAPNYYITDMALDKMHPSGNNIVSTIITPDNKSEWGIRDNNMIIYTGNIQRMSPEGYPLGFYMDVYTPHSGGSSAGYRTENASQINNGYTGSYIYGCALLQYSIRYLSDGTYFRSFPNYRGGESSYFSGMIPYFLPGGRYAVNGESYRFFGNTTVSFPDPTITGKFNDYVTSIKSINININALQSTSFTNGLVVVDERAYSVGYPEQVLAENGIKARRQFTLETVRSKMEEFLFSSQNISELICVNKTTGRTIRKIMGYSR